MVENASNPVVANLYAAKAHAVNPVALATMDRAIAEIERLTRERDEARSDMASADEQLQDQTQRWRVVVEERDRALAVLDRIDREILADKYEYRRWVKAALSGEPNSAPETNCSDPGWEMRDGDLTCKGCGRKARDIFKDDSEHDEGKASAAALKLFGTEKCPDCGVRYIPGARHFSGCASHPGELAQKATARPSEGPGSILGCACIMCEYHRSAEDIERKRRAEAGESPCGG